MPLLSRAPSLARRAAPAAGAVAAQVSQALASLLLQVLVSRALGEVGLSTYALLYGAVVLATAVGTGLVGDTLTVVDRGDPRVRAGLQWWSVLTALGLGGLGAVAVALGTGVGALGALVFGAAVAAFLLEDALRRLLMACGRWWRVVVVDLVALVGALGTVLVAGAAGHPASLTTFLLALLVGQVVAAVVAVPLLPRPERWLARWRGADLRVVVGFGTWRAAQQTLRPGMLTAARVVVIAALGAAAYGRVEAARLLVTPLTLVVSGVGNQLLASYARRRDLPPAQAVRRADRAALGLLAVSVVLGGAATALVPVLGGVVTGGRYAVDAAAVTGWVLYAATAALVLPYATLAAVQRRQAAVFCVRLADTAGSVALLGVLLLALDAGAAATPYALSVGSLVSAVAVRRLVLRPAAHR